MRITNILHANIMDGIDYIKNERQRQLEYNGELPYTEYDLKERVLVKAAVSYMFVQNHFKCQSETNKMPPVIFPFDRKYWNPNKDNDIMNLAKAGAYIASEIDRLIKLQDKQ